MQATPRWRAVNHGTPTDQLSLWAQPCSLPGFGGHERWAQRGGTGEDRDLDLKLSLHRGLARLCWGHAGEDGGPSLKLPRLGSSTIRVLSP